MNTVDPSTLLAPAPRLEPLTVPGRNKVPVTLLTGFLGAGKTTLLNRILSGEHGLRIGVLVNDFGAINIDASLVESVEENTISLVNGCVCCEVRDDLVTSLEELLGRVDTVDYVILEASGVADPGGIVMTFLDWKYRELLVLDSITCVVDAEGIFRDADDEYLTGLKLRQIAFADLVLLNKTDLVTQQHVEVVRDWIAAHLNRIRVVEATHGNAPLEILLGAGRFAEAQLPDGEKAHDHASDAFDRWSYESERPFSADVLREMVRKELSASVYRCKGIVLLDEAPERRFALQVVGRRVDLTELDGWDGRSRRSRIVAIGARGQLDAAGLRTLFESCHAEAPRGRPVVVEQLTREQGLG